MEDEIERQKRKKKLYSSQKKRTGNQGGIK